MELLTGPVAAEPLVPMNAEPVAPPAPTSITCPACQTVNPLDQPYCADCGYYFSETDLAMLAAAVRGRERTSDPNAY